MRIKTFCAKSPGGTRRQTFRAYVEDTWLPNYQVEASAGRASGPGWTGTACRFSAAATLTGPVNTRVSISGTVDIDRQGLARRMIVHDRGQSGALYGTYCP